MKKYYIASFLTILAVSPTFGQNCTDTSTLGSAANAYSTALTESNAIAVDNDLNTLVFVHRNNVLPYGGHSGQLRYDISTDNGINWTSNLGLLNPASVNGTNAARYPNVALYNPTNNTNPSNAYLCYYAPTVATTWNGHVSGVRKLDGTGNTENYNQAGATQTLIPRAMCKGAPGVYWAIDAVFNGTAVTGYRILKGTWNGTTNDVVWGISTTVTPAFNTNYDGTVYAADFAISFDPTGQIGWACILTDVSSALGGYSFDPVFYKTTNGGSTWSTPEQVDLSQFGCISSFITTNNFATAAFDVDITVDMDGNPHALMCVGSGPGTYSIFFTQEHRMFDITRENGMWNAKDLGLVPGVRNTFGTLPNQLTMDMEPQTSRTDDGSKVFFSWSGSDVTPIPDSPNLFGAAYDVATKMWTPMKDFTSCNTALNGKIMLPKMAENVLELSSSWRLPIIYASPTDPTDLLAPTNYVYLDSLQFTQADFVTPQCTATVNFTNPDTVHVCEGGNAILTLSGSYSKILWDNGSATTGILASAQGWYPVTVRSNCCIGRDSIYVLIDSLTNSAFTTTANDLSVNFTDQSTGTITTWFWDFGDGNTSNLQNPAHTYSAPGTYTVCLLTSDGCTPDTACQTITVTCVVATANFTTIIGGGGNDLNVSFTDASVGSPTSWFWDFGDGVTSTLQNPNYNYASSGTYTVCLIIQDSCGSDTICQNIQIDVTSLDELFAPNVSIYPNPTDGILHIEASELKGQNWTLILLNTLGEVFWIKTGTGEAIEETLETSRLSAGVYFLQVQSESGSARYKVVKR